MWSKNRAVRRYYRSIYKLLPSDRSSARKICFRIKDMTEAFLLEQPDAGYAEIVDRFGTPEQIAISSLEEQREESVLSKLKMKKRVLRIVAAMAVLVSLFVMSVAGFVAYECYRGANGKAIIEIIEENVSSGNNLEKIGEGIK